MWQTVSFKLITNTHYFKGLQGCIDDSPNESPLGCQVILKEVRTLQDKHLVLK